jgi:hypothetical protein
VIDAEGVRMLRDGFDPRGRALHVVATFDGTTERLWWRRPDARRVERGDEVVVRVGDRWWRWSPEHGAETNGDPQLSVSVGALETLVFVSAIEFLAIEVLAETTHLGRPAVHVRGTARRGEAAAAWGVWALDDDGAVEAVVDLATGLALRVEGRYVIEIDELEVDGDLPASLFDPPFPEGAEVRVVLPSPGPSTLARRVDLAEVRRRSGFAVVEPELADGWSRTSCLLDGTDPPRWAGLSYRHDPDGASLHVQQGPGAGNPEAGLGGWIDVDHVGRTFRVKERVVGGVVTHHVLVERDAALVWVNTTVSLELALHAAASIAGA